MHTKLQYRPYICNRDLLFPSRLDEDIDQDEPVRIIDSVVESLDLRGIHKLYKPFGRRAYDPKMLLKVVIYAYMNNQFSCRRIEKLLKRDIHYIWLSGYEKPDFITINRFRNRVKDEINHIFTQLVLILAEKGFVSLDVEYIDGTKIESRANKYTFVWKKRILTNRTRLIEKIKVLLEQVDEVIAQDNQAEEGNVGITPEALKTICSEMQRSLDSQPTLATAEERKARRQKGKQIKELQAHAEKLSGYDRRLEQMGDRNSMSKTDPDATFMRMKEDYMRNGQTKPGYNLQICAENQFITDFALFPNPTDTLTLIPFLNSFQERYGIIPSTIVADSGYGSEENYRYMDQMGMDAYVKYNWFHKEQRPRYKVDPFHPEGMYYNEKEDYYVCPMGQHMTCAGSESYTSDSGYRNEMRIYRSRNCKGCPLRCRCYKGETDRRTIKINHRLNQYKKKARELLTSEKGIEHRGRRCVEPEAVFGQIKYNIGYKRFRHFGKDKVTMDFAFFAIAFNLKKMCKMKAKNNDNGGINPKIRSNNVVLEIRLPENPFFDKILQKSAV